MHDAHYWSRTHSEPVVLDIGDEVGAMVLYTGPELHGREIEVSPVDAPDHRVHTAVLERAVNGRTLYAAVYPALAEGEYQLWGGDRRWVSRVTIRAGQVAEVHWRH